MNDSLFSRRLIPGEPVRPFLVSGVLEKDYPGPRGSAAQQQYLNEAFEEAEKILSRTDFRELDAFTLCGIDGRWKLCTAASPLYADGHYSVMEKLGLMPIFLHLRSEGAQTVRLRVQSGRLAAFLNGVSLSGDAMPAPPPRRGPGPVRGRGADGAAAPAHGAAGLEAV